MAADPLAKLVRQADAACESASVLIKRTLREIRGELANLSGELNLAGSAAARERVYNFIRKRYARLARMLDRIMTDTNEKAAKSAAISASRMTGLEVKYSPKRAEAICELVTPAQGENLAAVFTDRMSVGLINSLREATVGMLREQAVAGGTLKEMSKDLAARWSIAANEPPIFTDRAGRVWDSGAYLQMNVRTNAMRVYNDCLVDDVAKETGGDLMRISTGGDPDCPLCFPWEGCIVSISGKTKGFPTYAEARDAGCFHPNCVHTLEYVDEVADADEIALQKAHPVDKAHAADSDAQDERRYEIDQARYREQGMTAEEARVAVDRDNLEASIRAGLVREDAADIVRGMTDEQVTRLCPNGNPPAFEPTKGTKKHPETERWNHGKRGGVFHVAKGASAEHIIELLEQDAIKRSTQRATGMSESDKWKSRAKQAEIESEQAITQYQQNEANENSKRFGFPAIQGRHTFDDDVEMVNPNFSKGGGFAKNCQRCVIAFEARCIGLDVVAKPSPLDKDGRYNPVADLKTGFSYSKAFEGFKFLVEKHLITHQQAFESTSAFVASHPANSRFLMAFDWNHVDGKPHTTHVVNAVNSNGEMVVYDGQSSSVYRGDKLKTLFGRIEPGKIWIGRTDDKKINADLLGMALNPRRVRKGT